MINLISVTIANSFDDSTRFEVLAYHVEDTNANAFVYLPDLPELIEQYVKLETFNNERIVKISHLKVIDISTDKESSELVNSVLTTK